MKDLALVAVRKFARRVLKPDACTLRAIAKRHNVPYYFMGNGCDKNLESWIRAKNPDITVVYSMSELLKRNIWSIPRLGTINLHPSLLPAYRGPNPYWGMYTDMVDESGVTVHYIDDGEDTGDILAQAAYPVRLGTRLPELIELSRKHGAALVIQVLDKISLEEAVGIRQPAASPTPRARNKDLKEMWEMIDWDTWSIERVFHCLRYLESRLHRLEGLELPIFHRWEVVDFYRNGDAMPRVAFDKLLTGKAGAVLLRKRWKIPGFSR